MLKPVAPSPTPARCTRLITLLITRAQGGNFARGPARANGLSATLKMRVNDDEAHCGQPRRDPPWQTSSTLDHGVP
eukprot:2613959-Pleurochrysis_carterae.AAC.1